MNPISTGLNIFSWLFLRLPLGFSLPFTALSLGWVFGGFRWINEHFALPLTDTLGGLIASGLPGPLRTLMEENLSQFVHALIVIALFGVGFVVSYNISALINWILLPLKRAPAWDLDEPVHDRGTQPASDALSDVHRIGIVLAGGGAKGAFQAGAMRSIYRFLEENNALGKVRAIAGTSIGSWNALFWLSDLVKPSAGWSGESAHQRWWKSISAKSLTAPSWYLPGLRNAFLSSRPWKEVFDRIFANAAVAERLRASGIHFYFTRSNVGSGQLECVTNNPTPPTIARVRHEFIDPGGDRGAFMEGVKEGVFASMDIPPLFPFAARGSGLFEDGGVIDNLPIAFAAVEACDLIFVLPLNASFEEAPNKRSILARFLRVMDIRQGALERNGFKMLYLYNELAALRNTSAGVSAQRTESPNAPEALTSALHRKNALMKVFAICPARPFVEECINTIELWKRKQAAEAFAVMQQATYDVIRKTDFRSEGPVRVALVGQSGDITWDENF